VKRWVQANVRLKRGEIGHLGAKGVCMLGKACPNLSTSPLGRTTLMLLPNSVLPRGYPTQVT
jgi:hypothetical protein